MDQTAKVQEFETKKEARQHLRMQIEQYLEGQPESTQTFHRWMKRLEVAGLGLIVAAFIVATYLSINWKNVPQLSIPIAWFLFAASAMPAMVLVGLHAIVLRAFPPILIPGSLQKFVTGSQAVWTGAGLILTGLALAAFWGAFAYGIGTFNMALLEPLIRILAGVVGIGMTISILYNIYQKVTRSR